jgi:hypothetical protein
MWAQANDRIVAGQNGALTGTLEAQDEKQEEKGFSDEKRNRIRNL